MKKIHIITIDTISMKSDIYYHNFIYYNFNHSRVIIYIYILIFGSFFLNKYNKSDDFCRKSKFV